MSRSHEGETVDVVIRRGKRELYRGGGAWRGVRDGEAPDGEWQSVLAVRRFHGRKDSLTVEIDGKTYDVRDTGPSRSGPGFERLYLGGSS